MRRLPIMKWAVVCVAVLSGALFTNGRAQADAKVYERTLRSTAWVISPMGKDRTSFGTGFVIDVKRKWLLTNYHVVEDRKTVVVFFPEFKGDQAVSEPDYYTDHAEKIGIAGEVIATDSKRDLAMIELKKIPALIFELPLASRSAKPGEALHAIGNSGAGKDHVLWRYSKGEVRQVYAAHFKAKSNDGGSVEVEAVMVESQIPTNPGDSGGPVVNDRGELVGVTQSNDVKQRLVSYSVDVGEVRTFLRSTIKTKGEK